MELLGNPYFPSRLKKVSLPNMPELTVIIPARNEIYLEKTIRNVLANSRGDTEVAVILDGYLPDPPIETNSDKVIFYHFETSIGQRAAINYAAKRSTAKYIMKLDAHCAVAEGFDVELCRTGDELGWNVTQIPRMFNLDHEKFEPRCGGDFDEAIKRAKVNDYMYIGWNDKQELRTLYFSGKEHRRYHEARKHILIDDTMSCMGPGFFLNREWFLEHGGCDEEHGGWGQQGVEVACKAWLSGGRMVVNKRTWFAHWFRASDGGFPYPLSGREVAKARRYSKDFWLNNKWDKAVRPFQFLLDKFDPPGWNLEATKVVSTGYPYSYMDFPYVEGQIALDLGSGDRPKRPGIINVDIRPLPNVDLVMDLRKLELPDNYADVIISGDVLEHFGRHEILPILKEWFRVLKPGGKAYITTIDGERTMQKYLSGQIPWRKVMDAFYGAQKYEFDFHKVTFSKETIVEFFKNAGFQPTGMKRFTLHRNQRITMYAKKP